MKAVLLVFGLCFIDCFLKFAVCQTESDVRRLLIEEHENDAPKDNVFQRLAMSKIIETLLTRSPPVAESDVKYLLYTRESWTVGQPIKLGDREGLKGVDFNTSRETVFIAHGWTNDGDSYFCRVVRTAYLASGDLNVIVIDWGASAKQIYILAAMSVPRVAHHVARMIGFLRQNGMKTAKAVGHSLGAHLLGIAGYELKDKLDYVVGLDPVRFGYPRNYSPSEGISKLSAKTVEIIHTGFIGIYEPIGHVDFYVNGGINQNCGRLNMGCSHNFGYKIFATSLLPGNKYCGVKCDSPEPELRPENMYRMCRGNIELMGTNRNWLKSRGMFYVEASAIYPYVRNNRTCGKRSSKKFRCYYF